MAELQTYVCPNCGANTTNVENCEYCGSLLIRFAQRKININKDEYSIETCHVDIDMIKEFEKNLKRQEETNDRVVTDIYVKKNLHKCVSIDRTGFGKWNDGSSISLNDSNKGLIVILSFEAYVEYGNIIYSPATEKKVKMFKSLKSYPLFLNNISKARYNTNVYGAEQYVDEYAIDFGIDAEGAAILISEILSKVYKIEDSETFSYHTIIGDANIINSRDNVQSVIEQRVHAKQQRALEEIKKYNREKYGCAGVFLVGLLLTGTVIAALL